MFVANMFIFIFLYLFKDILSQSNGTFPNITINPLLLCNPFALGINYPNILNQTDCSILSVDIYEERGLDLVDIREVRVSLRRSRLRLGWNVLRLRQFRTEYRERLEGVLHNRMLG